MTRRVAVVQVPRDSSIPSESISAPEWHAVQTDAATAVSTSLAAVTQATLANTRVFDVRQFGDTGTPNDSAAFQDALNAASPTGAVVTMPTGNYSLTQPLDLGNATLDLNGSTLDFSNAGLPSFTTLVAATGSTSTLPSMSVAMSTYANQITFASAHGLEIGDWVIVYNPSDFSFSNVRNYYRNGQFFQVADTPSTTTIVTRGRAAAAFPTSCNMFKMEPAKGTIRNGTIKGEKGSSYIAVVLEYTAGSGVDDLTVIDCEREFVNVRRSVDFRLSNVQGNNRMPEGSGDFYGITIGNSQSGYVEGCRIVSRRSPFTIGGGGVVGSVPNRFIRVRNNFFTTVGTHAGMGFHGNSEYIVYEENTVEGTVLIGGDHVTVRANDITTYRSSAISGTTELLGFNHNIDSNNIYIRNTWDGFGAVPIHIDAGSVGTGMQDPNIGSVIRDGGTLRITNNRVVLEAPGDANTNTSVVSIRKLSTCTASALSVDVSGNVFIAGAKTGAATRYAVALRCTDGVAFFSIRVTDNDFGNLPLYLWGAHALTTVIRGNTMINNHGIAGIFLNSNGSPYFPYATIDIAHNSIINAENMALYIVSNASETVMLNQNTMINPNRHSATGANGSAVNVVSASTLILDGNLFGDMISPTRMTRYVTYNGVGLVIERENTRVGSSTSNDVLLSVGARKFVGDVTGNPEGSVIASPGSVARSDNGNVYRKSTGTGNTGWVAMS